MLSNISFISSIGFILGPAIGSILQLIELNIGNGLIITSNMLCGYFIMTLCFIQLLLTMIFFDNKTQTKLSTRNTFTRTLTIQQRGNGLITTYSTPCTPYIDNIIIPDNITPPPPKLIHNKHSWYKKKQQIQNQQQILNFSDASPVSLSQRSIKSNKSLRRWLDSASPPSALPCIPDDDNVNNGYPEIKEKEEDIHDNGIHISISTPNLSNNHSNHSNNHRMKLTQNISHDTGYSTLSECKDKEYRKLTNTASYKSFSIFSDNNTFHRTSVAEMLNIETPSAICTPYTPYIPHTPHTPHTPLNVDDHHVDDDNDDNDIEIGIDHHYNDNVTVGKNKKQKTIKYIRTYATWNKFVSVIMTFCFLVHFEAFSIQQTMTSYLIQRKFDWKADFANYLYILCGIMWMASFYFINKLLLLSDKNRVGLVKISLIMGVISTFCLIFITFRLPDIKYNEYLYLFGFILSSFQFPFGRAAVFSLYALCTNYNYLEWIYLTSMISRIITPFIGIGLYFTNNGSIWTYGNITVLFMIAFILCSFTFSSLKKEKIAKNPSSKIFYHGYSIINVAQIFYLS